MKRALSWIVPRSLAGQMALTVALALLVAQMINFALIVNERNRQLTTGIAAPAVSRIVDALEPGSVRVSADDDEDRWRGRRRVMLATSLPPVRGQPRTDVAHRATEMLEDYGITPVSVLAFDDRLTVPMRLRDAVRHGRPPGESWAIRQMTVAVQYQPGKWALTRVRLPDHPPKIGGWLVAQTLILYIIVLVPLWWVGSRLARPLKALTRSARQFAETGSADPVAAGGPGDLRDLTAAFNDMRARLLAMLDEKDRMLGAIGHDLRTPLASLRVRAESVEDEGERARMAETIEEMSRMLDDILALARAGRSLEEPQKVDLSALADAVVEDFIELGSPVDLEDGPRIVAPVRAQLVRRAVRNLIENAVVYGNRAHVRVEQSGGEVRIVVRDEGPGIDPERIEEMLQPFTRLEGSRNRETGGAGLGLALVRAIMAEHKGRLALTNHPDGGLEAVLGFPEA